MAKPSPLPTGSMLNGRYRIDSVIGSGGFSIVYLARDAERGDSVVVKELVPPTALRNEGRVLDLGHEAHRLRRKFLEEGAIQGRFAIKGLVPVRSWFAENGSAYIVSEYLPDTTTLQELLRKTGPLSEDGALDIFYQLLETVEQIHERGVLHRDIKPSNVLVSKNGLAHLIDFGSAREWQADSNATQTVVFTPGFAPPEQLSEKARRGPATDIYALCATLFQMLSGQPPASCVDRASGVALHYPGSSVVSRLLESGLSLNMLDRPQSISELTRLLEAEQDRNKTPSLEDLDNLLVRSQRFVFNRRQCPACGGILEDVRPLRKGVCAVCREGIVRSREIHERLCPACHSGALHKKRNDAKPFVCPCCHAAALEYKRTSWLKLQEAVRCPRCEASGEFSGGCLTMNPSPTAIASSREPSDVVWWCDGCSAMYEELDDGRWEQTTPFPLRYVSLYPEEWARVAAGLDPAAGNAECESCGADYFRDERSLTLLAAPEDPNGFAKTFLGRRLPIEDVRWLAVGKSSPRPGLVCDDCKSEFDKDGPDLTLVYSSNRSLVRAMSESHSLENWQRIGKGLPTKLGEADLEESIGLALLESYEEGRVGFDGKPDLLWRGPVTRESGQSAPLTITIDQITVGGLLKKWHAHLEEIERCDASDEVIRLRLADELLTLQVTPIDLTAQLQSGTYTVTLSAEHLCSRITAEIKKQASQA